MSGASGLKNFLASGSAAHRLPGRPKTTDGISTARVNKEVRLMVMFFLVKLLFVERERIRLPVINEQAVLSLL
jgi:hypothetical protein